MSSGKRASEPSHPTQYLPHDSAHHPCPTAHPSDSSSTRARRQKPKKKREDKYEEEVQFNIIYFNDNRAGRRMLAQSSRMTEEEGQPPPAYENAIATSVSTLVSEDYVHQSGPSLPNQTAISLPSTPIIGNRQHIDRTDTRSLNSVPSTILADEDASSVELVDLDLGARWESERQGGVPLDERARRHMMRMDAVTPAVAPQRTRVFSQPATRRSMGIQYLPSQLSVQIPEDQDQYEDERTQSNSNSDVSSPPTPKNHRLPHIPVSPSKFFHIRSQSPQPQSSVISLIRNPSPFFKSSPSVLSLPHPHNGNHNRSRKIFNRKSKERTPTSSEHFDEWEFLDSNGPSVVNAVTTTPPLTPQNKLSRHFPTMSGASDQRRRHKSAGNKRAQKAGVIQIPQASGSNMHLPGSPPFVSRPIRRHTDVSNGEQTPPSSSPVSPVSVSSVTTFESATTTLSKTTAGDDAQDVVESTACSPEPRHSTPMSRNGDLRPSRISSPAPPPTATYDHNVELPIASCVPSGLPARSATERIVRTPELRDGSRGRVGLRSAPAYSMLFPSGPPFPIPCSQTPPQEVQTLPPLPPSKCPPASACAAVIVSSPLSNCSASATCPPPSTSVSFGLSQPSRRSSSCTRSPAPAPAPAPTFPSPQTPRRHYPGRPLPATPPVSPSLTWILDGQSRAPSHPCSVNTPLMPGQSTPGIGIGTPILLSEKMAMPYVSHTPAMNDPVPVYTQYPEKAPRTPPMPEHGSNTPARPMTPCTPLMPGAFSHSPPILAVIPRDPLAPPPSLDSPPVPEGLLIDLSDDDNSPNAESPADVPTSPDILDLVEPPPAPAPRCIDLLDFGEHEKPPLGDSNSIVDSIDNRVALPRSLLPSSSVHLDLLNDDPHLEGGDGCEKTNGGVKCEDCASDNGTVSLGDPLTPSTIGSFTSPARSFASLVPVRASGGKDILIGEREYLGEEIVPVCETMDAPHSRTPYWRLSGPSVCKEQK